MIKQAEAEAKLEASRILTEARLQQRMELLKTRRELIDRVLKAALQREEFKKAQLKKEIVSREGLREETLPAERLLSEVGPEVENDVVEWLKI